MSLDDNKDSDLSPPSGIEPVSITDELKSSYLDYAMSVIVARALPDVRDGLKPVHRRILYSMHKNGYDWNKPFRKSARVVGDVIGKYHPHGEGAVYDALVRMAQPFSLRMPLVDGQGNFGSVDGDMAAAMRYTEVRLQKISDQLLCDIEKDTVDFQDNYDGSETEPKVLPARFPNLLINGGGGIAVGMATNIPPHNPREIIDAVITIIDNPALEFQELLEIVTGPDFPTGAEIIGYSGIRSAYATGRGSITIRGKSQIEPFRKDREAIIITEIPYQVNKAAMIERIAELVRDKRVEGISDIRDESDRQGMRVVIELKRDANASIVLNQLYRYSSLQTTFGANLVALIGGRPQLMSLRQMLDAFIDFREEAVGRRIRFLLTRARDRAHILVGLAIAVANVDEIVRLIRAAPDPAVARAQLMERRWPAGDVAELILLIDDPRHIVLEDDSCRLSERQARAILDLRLQRLTALGRDEIAAELNELGKKIAEYLEILRSRERIMQIIKEELAEIRDQYSDARRTEISGQEDEFEDEDLIQRENMVVTVSHEGYIKRVALDTYRAQRRGGKGRSGMSTREADFVTRMFVASTHAPVVFFSLRGIAYLMKVWRLPQGGPNALGKAMINLLPLQKGEKITSIMPLPEEQEKRAGLSVMFATRSGTIRRNHLSDFEQINRNGKIAMKLDGDDEIIGVEPCDENCDVLLTTEHGQCIRFAVTDVRIFASRNSVGVRGISLAPGDKVISMSILRHFEADGEERTAYLKMRRMREGDGAAEETEEIQDEGSMDLDAQRYEEMRAAEETILTLSRNGFGKRSSSFEYRITNRGGKGISAMAVNARNGDIIASFPTEADEQIMLVTDGGQLIRCPVKDIRQVGRAAQGVIIFNTGDGEKVVAAERIKDIVIDE